MNMKIFRVLHMFGATDSFESLLLVYITYIGHKKASYRTVKMMNREMNKLM